MKTYRPCSFRIENEIGVVCSIAIQPTAYNISPSVCGSCTIPYPACKNLESEILLGENNIGGVAAMVTKAWCRKKGISINTFTFKQCEACQDFEQRLPPAPLDPLTKLYLKDYLDKNIISLFNQSSQKNPLSLVFLDIDHFKMVNDLHGHKTGDIVLADVSKTIKQTASSLGVCCRFGGEEIVILLPHTSADQAKILAESIRQRVANLKFPRGDNQPGDLQVTISSGISEHPKYLSTAPSELIEQADKALYRAKEEGRNRAYIFDPYLDSEESSESLEVDFYGQPPTAKGGKVLILTWIPYPTNPKKIMAVNIEDVRTGIQSYPSQERKEEIINFLGKPIEFSFQGKIESINLTEKRSIFLLKVRKSVYEKLTDQAISFFEKKKKDMDKNIKMLRQNRKN
ncbi:MAG: GGDEF domain-containing protein [bacterium]